MDALNDYRSDDGKGKGGIKTRKRIDRYPDVPAPGVWYWYGDWSVVHIGKLMKHASGVDGSKFTQWEAMKDEEIVRAGSWDDLEEKIKNWEEVK
jgi:hypothetical protein